MTFAVLPVKSPRQAMQRLRSLLAPAEREALARALFAQTLDCLTRVAEIERLVVASDDAGVLQQAADLGADTLLEPRQVGHSSSADQAAAYCKKEGAESVLLAPIDVPAARESEFTALVQAARALDEPSLLIVPSSDGTGTNALVRAPPDGLSCRFGPGSFARHRAEAEQSGYNVAVERPPGVIFDIDTPEDVALFLQRESLGPIVELLLEMGVDDRLSEREE